MKKLLLILVIPILSLLESCCNAHRDCQFYNRQVFFQGFTRNEIDTVDFIVFENNVSNPKAIDSFFRVEYLNKSAKDSNEIFIYLNQEINKNLTYKVRLNNLGLEYIINDFATKRKACDECFGQKSKWTDYIGGYNINGVYKEQEKITIYR